jgi:hypothetical protein
MTLALLFLGLGVGKKEAQALKVKELLPWARVGELAREKGVKDDVSVAACIAGGIIPGDDVGSAEATGKCCGKDPNTIICTAAVKQCELYYDGKATLDGWNEKAADAFKAGCKSFCAEVADAPSWCPLSTTIIIVIVVVVVVVVAAIVGALVFFCIIKKRS